MPCSVSMAIHVDSSEWYLVYVLLDQNMQVSVAVVQLVKKCHSRKDRLIGTVLCSTAHDCCRNSVNSRLELFLDQDYMVDIAEEDSGNNRVKPSGLNSSNSFCRCCG